MSLRSDNAEGMKAEMHDWYWESEEKAYKDIKPIYPRITEVHGLDEIKGGYWKSTSALGATRLEDRTAQGKYQEDNSVEGFTVYATIKDKALTKECPRELKRDWHRTADWLKDYINKNMPAAVSTTKDEIATDLYNYGGYTSGDDVFDNDDTQLNLTTYTTSNLGYDGLPMINRSDNLRTAKSGSTFYNGVALANISYANALTMYKLYIDTNAYKENAHPFDNSGNIIIMCKGSNVPDWQIVNESTLNPDNANNPKNPLKGVFKDVIANPYLTTANFSCMLRDKNPGIKYFVGDPYFNFWEENNPEAYWASVIIDYAIGFTNFRFMIANNAPKS